MTEQPLNTLSPYRWENVPTKQNKSFTIKIYSTMTYHNQFLVRIEKEHLTIDLNKYIPKADFASIDFIGVGTTYMLSEPRFPMSDDEHTVYKMVGVRLYTNASNLTIDIICEDLDGSHYIIQADQMTVDGETFTLIDRAAA